MGKGGFSTVWKYSFTKNGNSHSVAIKQPDDKAKTELTKDEHNTLEVELALQGDSHDRIKFCLKEGCLHTLNS